jgi:hypothetical protein
MEGDTNTYFVKPEAGMLLKPAVAVYSLTDSNGKVLFKGKMDAGSTGGAILKGLFMGGIMNFRLSDEAGNQVASTKAVFTPIKAFEIYKEPDHQFIYKVSFNIFSLTRGLAISDASGKELWSLESSMNPLKALTHALYKSDGHVQIGSYVFDFKTKVHSITCSDQSFPPMLLLALWLIALMDTNSRSGGMMV